MALVDVLFSPQDETRDRKNDWEEEGRDPCVDLPAAAELWRENRGVSVAYRKSAGSYLLLVLPRSLFLVLINKKTASISHR